MPEARLLSGEELAQRVSESVQTANGEIFIVSAYLKLAAIEWVASNISKGVRVHVLSRWNKADLVSGASDLSVFEFCKSLGWSFYIEQTLHAKAVLVDKKFLALGSSNYTNNGLSLFASGNKELNIEVFPSNEECTRIRKFFSDAYALNTPMFNILKKEVESAQANLESKQSNTWSSQVSECFLPVVDKIWTDECLRLGPSCFFNKPSDDMDYSHDKSLWSGAPSLDKFMALKIFKWLSSVVEEENEPLRFGYLSSKLHDVLINDPKPYRKDVKEYLRVLLEWIEYYEIYQIQKHAHTVSLQRIKNG